MQHNNKRNLKGRLFFYSFPLLFHLLSVAMTSCLFYEFVGIITFITFVYVFPRITYTKNQLNDSTIFKNNKSINACVDNILKKRFDTEMAIEKIRNENFEERDIKNYFEVLKSLHEMDRSIMMSICISVIVSSVFSVRTDMLKGDITYETISMIVILSLATGFSYILLPMIDIGDLGKKRFLLQLYISEKYDK